MAEDVTLSDPLKKVIKVTDNLSWDWDLLGNIRKENPNLNINWVSMRITRSKRYLSRGKIIFFSLPY